MAVRKPKRVRSRPKRLRAKRTNRRTTSNTVIKFERDLERFVTQELQRLDKDVKRRILPRVKRLAKSFKEEKLIQNTDQDRDLDLFDLIDLVEATFLGRFTPDDIRNHLQGFFENLGEAVDEDLIREFATQQLAVAPTETDRRTIRTSVERSTGNIEDLSKRVMSDIRSEITRGLERGERWESIASKLEAPLNSSMSTPLTKARDRARLIARNEVSTALGEINREKQTSAGIELYEWQTSEDERVRDTHRDLNEKVFSWNETGTIINGVFYPPASDPNYENGAPTQPGEPYNCRCVAIPVIPELEDL